MVERGYPSYSPYLYRNACILLYLVRGPSYKNVTITYKMYSSVNLRTHLTLGPWFKGKSNVQNACIIMMTNPGTAGIQKNIIDCPVWLYARAYNRQYVIWLVNVVACPWPFSPMHLCFRSLDLNQVLSNHSVLPTYRDG